MLALDLRDRQLTDGATPGPLCGVQQILHYGDWKAEHAALVDGAGIACLSDALCHVEATGPDRATFLNRLATNQLDRLAPGSGCETFLTDAKGRTLAYLWVFARAESLVLCSARGEASKVIAHLDRYLIREKVELRDRSDDWGTFLLSGEQMPRLFSSLTRGTLGESPLASIETNLSDIPVLLTTLEPAGPPRFLVTAPRDRAAALWNAIRQAGARPCGQLGAEALRIESGWPLYGVDITPENLPQEIDRDARTLSFHKGCYLGQETIARLDSRGHVNRTLVGVRFEGEEPPPCGMELTAEEAAVGRVTSATFSPLVGAAIALAYVRRGHNQPGQRFSSPLGPAEVVRLPVPRCLMPREVPQQTTD
jgi:folate-binding protein YgfZ